MSKDEAFLDVLQRARAGDREAWVELFARVGDQEGEGAVLVAMARRVLPSGDRLRNFVDSRDLLQSALRSGWLNIDNF